MSDEPFPGSPDDMMNTIAALRDRNATLEGVCRSAGLCMSCLYGAADPIGCTDCLGTGWDGGDPHRQIEVLEARVAKLEAALTKISTATRRDIPLWSSSDPLLAFIVAEVDAALKDAPGG